VWVGGWVVAVVKMRRAEESLRQLVMLTHTHQQTLTNRQSHTHEHTHTHTHTHARTHMHTHTHAHAHTHTHTHTRANERAGKLEKVTQSLSSMTVPREGAKRKGGGVPRFGINVLRY
jgi:ABC-type Zn2+ transport system substrate-binding protein/surface adhesin